MVKASAGHPAGTESGQTRIQIRRPGSHRPLPPLDLRTPSGKQTLPY